MAENLTKPTEVDPTEFIAAVEHPTRRADAETLLAMMQRVTGYPPQMWGPTIVGFGRYHYEYDSGHSGDAAVVGFSPRKANLSVYITTGYDGVDDQLARLGKHKVGASCMYINKLADVDLAVLEEIIAASVTKMRATYDTWPT